MKIDPSSAVANQVVTERKSQAVNTESVSASKSATVDRTTLSTSVPTVSNLVQQAMLSPAVRQDKVNTLRDAVLSGNYPIDTVKIAGAIADEGSQ